jgi:hypothetical protein
MPFPFVLDFALSVIPILHMGRILNEQLLIPSSLRLIAVYVKWEFVTRYFFNNFNPPLPPRSCDIICRQLLATLYSACSQLQCVPTGLWFVHCLKIQRHEGKTHPCFVFNSFNAVFTQSRTACSVLYYIPVVLSDFYCRNAASVQYEVVKNDGKGSVSLTKKVGVGIF